MTVTVETLARRSKTELAVQIADMLKLPHPDVSEGSSVFSGFLDEIYKTLFGTSPAGSDTYRKAENLINRLDLQPPYDPRWDTSEARGDTGGGTVTTRAFSRILTALNREPRVFLVPLNGAVSPPTTLEFDSRPSRNAFAEAGPGSLIMFTEESRPGFLHCLHVAEVLDMTPGWSAPWHVSIGPNLTLSRAVELVLDVSQSGRVLELPYAAFVEAIREVGGSPADMISIEGYQSNSELGVSTPHDIDRLFPVSSLVLPLVRIPDPVIGDLNVPEGSRAPYQDNAAYRADISSGLSVEYSRPPERTIAKAIETRAIEVVIRSLRRADWTLIRDCQRDGVGYDLLFEKGSRPLHVEVKGIQGPQLAFNVTPKEWWRATTDADWILLAVTNALSPVEPVVNVLRRDVVVNAQRVVTGYRIVI